MLEAWTWLQEAARQNILALTSVCNVHCRFCSHYQNPPEVQTVEIPPLSWELIEKLLAEIYPERPLVIGESITRIREGECLTHPQIKTVLSRIRTACPHTEIWLTTNGSLLDEEMADFLAELGQVRITLSLNTASAENRRLLMRDRWAEQAVKAPIWLQKYQIPFQGSIVAMPQLLGWEDLEQTLAYLAEFGAENIRIFRPGYTDYGRLALGEGLELQEKLAFKVAFWQKKYPVTLEPPDLQDLQARIAGVIRHSPAEKAGLQSGDLITAIGGQKPFSRVDAFEALQQSGSVQLQIVRNGQEQVIFLNKLPFTASGLIMDYDLNPGLLAKIKKELKPWRNRKILWLCSTAGEKVLRAGMQEKLRDYNLTLQAVPNSFFGGSISCAGLLTVRDLGQALREAQTEAVLLPAAAFDRQQQDLTGQSWAILKEFCQKNRILSKLL